MSKEENRIPKEQTAGQAIEDRGKEEISEETLNEVAGGSHEHRRVKLPSSAD